MILKWVRKLEEGEAKAADVVVMLFTVADASGRAGVVWQAICHSATVVGAILMVKTVKPIHRTEVMVRHIAHRFTSRRKESSNA